MQVMHLRQDQASTSYIHLEQDHQREYLRVEEL